MKQNYLPSDRRNCGHCGGKDSLSYYHELDENDLYWCNKCYGVTVWNGNNKWLIDGEAYPDRNK